MSPYGSPRDTAPAVASNLLTMPKAKKKIKIGSERSERQALTLHVALWKSATPRQRRSNLLPYYFLLSVTQIVTMLKERFFVINSLKIFVF